MLPVTVIIPNYNGKQYLDNCLKSLFQAETDSFPVIIVDNGSEDDSHHEAVKKYPFVKLVSSSENLGFAAAVNAGIRRADTPFVLLLNNDTVSGKGFISALYNRIKDDKKIFGVQARMMSLNNPDIIDSAGDLYCALGWAASRGRGKAFLPSSETGEGDAGFKYDKAMEIFSPCGGAVLYRRDILIRLGLFDENYFAYLEDVDIAYRAKLLGYKNLYEPTGIVYHAGSGYSGSRHNAFKVRLSAGNSLYLAYKNMPLPVFIANFPLLFAGHIVKFLYFTKKGLGGAYIQGIKRGLNLIKPIMKGHLNRPGGSLFSYIKIEAELIKNIPEVILSLK